MDSSDKDTTFDFNPLREQVAKATLTTFYHMFSLKFNFYSSL